MICVSVFANSNTKSPSDFRLSQIKSSFLSIPPKNIMERHQFIERCYDQYDYTSKELKSQYFAAFDFLNDEAELKQYSSHVHFIKLYDTQLKDIQYKHGILDSLYENIALLSDSIQRQYTSFWVLKADCRKVKAIPLLTEMYEDAKIKGDSVLMINIINSLFKKFAYAGRDVTSYDFSLLLSCEGKEIAAKIGYREFDTNYLLGYNYSYLGVIDSTLFYFEKIYDSSQKEGKVDQILLSIIALINHYMTNYKSDITYQNKINKLFQRGVEILPKVARQDVKVKFYNRMSAYFNQIKDYDLALKYSRLLYQECQDDNYETWWKHKAKKWQAIIYENKKMYLESLLALKESTYLLNDFEDLQHKYELSGIRKEYTIRENKRKIEVQKAQLAAQNIILQKEFVLRNSLLFIIFSGGLLGIFLYRQIKEKRELNSILKTQNIKIGEQNISLKNSEVKIRLLLEQKQRELLSNSMSLSKKNKLLTDLEGKINNLQKEFTGNDKALKAVKEISGNLNFENQSNWNGFKIQFEAVHPSFFETLKKMSPKLTENDLRQCAYLYLGLTNKEIANILYMNPKSISVTRSRIKKKFGIGIGIKLRDHLSNLLGDEFDEKSSVEKKEGRKANFSTLDN